MLCFDRGGNWPGIQQIEPQILSKSNLLTASWYIHTWFQEQVILPEFETLKSTDELQFQGILTENLMKDVVMCQRYSLESVWGHWPRSLDDVRQILFWHEALREGALDQFITRSKTVAPFQVLLTSCWIHKLK